MDKDVLKALALTPKYRRTDIKVLAEMLYKTETTGRATTENDMRPATELVKDVVDVDKISKDQMDRIFSDPKARAEFLAKKYS